MILRKNSFYILFIVATVILGSCAIKKESPLKGILLSWQIPVLDKELDTIFNIQGSNKMFFYKDLVLYKKEDIRISDGKSSSIYYYWMFKSGSTTGLKYSHDLKEKAGIKFDVDSFLFRNAFKNKAFNDRTKDSLVNTESMIDKNKFVEKYAPKSSPDDSYPDTLIFEFDKRLIDIPYSFSPEMEKMKKAKLVRITGVFNPVADSRFKAARHGRKMVFQIERLLSTDVKEESNYFNRFEQDNK